MSETEFSNPVALAQHNLDEANRQLASATSDFNAGDITQARLDQLHELRDFAAADLVRVTKEN
jgi:outer membrane protein TolC